MLCRDKKSIGMAALVLAVALSLPQVVRGAETDDGLNQAMQAFVNAIKSKNGGGVLEAFSRTIPFKHVVYPVVNLQKPDYQKLVTYKEIERDFQNKKDWYESFLGSSDEAPFELHIKITDSNVKWARKGTTFNAVSSTWARFYITWRKEGNKWVIAEIGDTMS